MELINLIFRLGVVFAIFAFIWFFISLGLKLLTGGIGRKALGEIYLIKGLQYFFLVNVTFLICYNQFYSGIDVNRQLVLGGIILLMYFMSKLQSGQKRMNLIKFYANGIQTNLLTQFNIKYEIVVIVLSVALYGLFYFQPDFAQTALSVSFKNAILNIEDTPIFGFIFKIVGFFSLIGVINKLFNTLILLFTGRLFKGNNEQESFNGFNSRNRKEDDFDDYEEVRDELNQ